MNIDAYLGMMHEYLTGRASEPATADALERAGFAPTAAPPTFGVYRELVTRQWRAVLDHFFRAARAFAVTGLEPGSRTWEELTRDFYERHPPCEGNPNEFCLPFATYLEQGEHRAELVELADFASTRYRAMHAAHDALARVESDVFARSYAFDVVSFSRRVEAGEAAGALAAAPTTVIVGRSRHTHALRVVRASLGALVALSEADGSAEQASTTLPHGLTRAMIDGERAALAREGLLP